MIDKLYIIPSYKCNLNCPHCDLHLINEEFDESAFLSKLKDVDASEIILFGGEPLLNRNILMKCLETNKITSISTNLLLLNDENAKLLKKHNLYIATSWNPNRFTETTYKQWLEKLKLLKQHNLTCSVLITLTEDLLSMDMDSLLSIIKDIDDIGSVDGIQFEHLIDYNAKKDLHKRADKWLCKLHYLWEFKTKNIIEEQVKYWHRDCSKTYTLTPSGILKKGCPQYVKAVICDDCYTCQLAKICRPCALQNCCSFPKELYNLINISYKNCGEKNGNSSK